MIETRIFYLAPAAAPDWEDRVLLPHGGLTTLLGQEIDYGNHPIPKPGDRLRQYGSPEDPDGGTTHGCDSDWLVSEVEVFVSDRGGKVVICHCTHSPIARDWQFIPLVAV